MLGGRGGGGKGGAGDDRRGDLPGPNDWGFGRTNTPTSKYGKLRHKGKGRGKGGRKRPRPRPGQGGQDNAHPPPPRSAYVRPHQGAGGPYAAPAAPPLNNASRSLPSLGAARPRSNQNEDESGSRHLPPPQPNGGWADRGFGGSSGGGGGRGGSSRGMAGDLLDPYGGLAMGMPHTAGTSHGSVLLSSAGGSDASSGFLPRLGGVDAFTSVCMVCGRLHAEQFSDTCRACASIMMRGTPGGASGGGAGGVGGGGSGGSEMGAMGGMGGMGMGMGSRGTGGTGGTAGSGDLGVVRAGVGSGGSRGRGARSRREREMMIDAESDRPPMSALSAVTQQSLMDDDDYGSGGGGSQSGFSRVSSRQSQSQSNTNTRRPRPDTPEVDDPEVDDTSGTSLSSLGLL